MLNKSINNFNKRIFALFLVLSTVNTEGTQSLYTIEEEGRQSDARIEIDKCLMRVNSIVHSDIDIKNDILEKIFLIYNRAALIAQNFTDNISIKNDLLNQIATNLTNNIDLLINKIIRIREEDLYTRLIYASIIMKLGNYLVVNITQTMEDKVRKNAILILTVKHLRSSIWNIMKHIKCSRFSEHRESIKEINYIADYIVNAIKLSALTKKIIKEIGDDHPNTSVDEKTEQLSALFEISSDITSYLCMILEVSTILNAKIKASKSVAEVEECIKGILEISEEVNKSIIEEETSSEEHLLIKIAETLNQAIFHIIDKAKKVNPKEIETITKYIDITKALCESVTQTVGKLRDDFEKNKLLNTTASHLYLTFIIHKIQDTIAVSKSVNDIKKYTEMISELCQLIREIAPENINGEISRITNYSKIDRNKNLTLAVIYSSDVIYYISTKIEVVPLNDIDSAIKYMESISALCKTVRETGLLVPDKDDSITEMATINDLFYRTVYLVEDVLKTIHKKIALIKPEQSPRYKEIIRCMEKTIIESYNEATKVTNAITNSSLQEDILAKRTTTLPEIIDTINKKIEEKVE